MDENENARSLLSICAVDKRRRRQERSHGSAPREAPDPLRREPAVRILRSL